MAAKAVFLDRDGVINRERGEHTWELEDFEILPDVVPALKALHDAGWLSIVISNQSGIGLGLYGHADVKRLHGYLHDRLAATACSLDAVYYCPHHPEHGALPLPQAGGLLFERAIARFRIDAARSIMIGDKERDITAAASAGVRGILVAANAPLLPALEASPPDLMAAAR